MPFRFVYILVLHNLFAPGRNEICEFVLLRLVITINYYDVYKQIEYDIPKAP